MKTVMKTYPQRTGALCANSHPGSYTGQDAFNDMLPVIEVEQSEKETNKWKEREYLARENDGAGSGRKYVLRRLTPVECARLQGFPDWWCDGADGSDSAQYKMWGNGIALPCATDVLGRIALAAEKND